MQKKLMGAYRKLITTLRNNGKMIIEVLNSDASKQIAKAYGLVFTITFLFFGIAYLAVNISGAFPDYVTPQAASEIVNALINVDGLLLGFTGVIYAQLFSGLMQQQNTIIQKSLDNLSSQSYYERSMNEFSKRRSALIFAMTISFTFLLGSIISAIINLSTISSLDQVKDKIAPFGATVLPIFLLVFSVVVLFVALAGTSFRPPSNKKGQTILHKGK